FSSPREVYAQGPARSVRTCLAVGRARAWRAATAIAPSRQPDEKAPQTDARRDGVSLALWRAGLIADASRPSLCFFFAGLFSCRLLRARRVALGCLWRQLEMARSHLVSYQLLDYQISAQV